MLSQSLHRFLQTFNNTNVTVRLCSTIAPASAKTKVSQRTVTSDIHSICVSGKVINIYDGNYGSVSFLIKSILPGKFSKVHKIVVSHKNPTLLSVVKSRLALDHQVYVEGKLSSDRFVTESGKHRTTSVIIPGELRILESFAVANKAGNSEETEPLSFDENAIELVGSISTAVAGDEFKTFSFANVKNSRLSSKNPENLNYNRIFVYDKALFPLIETAQIKRDNFLLRGEISYRLFKNEHGRTITSSYITAKQMYRI